MSVIGAGLMGTLHAVNYTRLGDRVQLVRVFDVEPERAERLAARTGAVAAPDLESALAGDIDAVTICVPPRDNRPLAELAFSRGKHVFLEKPIALTLVDADAILRAAEVSRRRLMIGLVLRFWPGYVAVHEGVVSARHGRPVVVRASRLQPPAAWGTWISDHEKTGGIAPLVMVHDLDQANWLLGQPRQVTARALLGRGDRASHVATCVEYDAGTALVEASMAMPQSYPLTSSLSVLCESGALQYDFESAADGAPGESSGTDRLFAAGDQVVVVDSDSSARRELRIPSGAEPWQPELSYFLDCVEGDSPVLTGSGAQARAALAVALAVNHSLETGMPQVV
jgi:predicted dehydrogenase